MSQSTNSFNYALAQWYFSNALASPYSQIASGMVLSFLVPFCNSEQLTILIRKRAFTCEFVARRGLRRKENCAVTSRYGEPILIFRHNLATQCCRICYVSRSQVAIYRNRFYRNSEQLRRTALIGLDPLRNISTSR